MIERPNYSPIPVDVWNRENDTTDSYYTRAIGLLEGKISDAVQDGRLNGRLREPVESIALSLLARQCAKNGDVKTQADGDDAFKSDEAWDLLLHGLAKPGQIVEFVARNHTLRHGIEVARLTHFGIWDTRDSFDRPVQKALLRVPAPHGRLTRRPLPYELRGGCGDIEVIAMREETAVHCGDPLPHTKRLSTIKEQNIAIDLDAAIRTESGEEVAMVVMDVIKRRDGRREQSGQAVDDTPITLDEHLDPLLRSSLRLRPGWMMPLLSTMFTSVVVDNKRSDYRL